MEADEQSQLLLNDDELPHGFTYPGAFRRHVERGLIHLEPWWLFPVEHVRIRMSGLAQRYPKRTLVPFAKRGDNDDVACFDMANPGQVVVIHDFASEGWERPRVFENFYAWLRRAVEDMIEFDDLEEPWTR